MSKNRFANFLEELGYSKGEIADNLEADTFTYSIELHDPDLDNILVNRIDLKYVYTPAKESLFEAHSIYWNRNDVTVFFALGDDSCHIINAKSKPDEKNPLNKGAVITTFDYGMNSTGFEKEKLEKISKEYIDSTYFFDFVIKKQRTIHEVDKDLLLNLIALKTDLIGSGSEKIIHLLILRCLFIKYLEDRKIYEENYLLNILKSGVPGNLIDAFDELQKINGDIFKQDKLTADDIEPLYLEKSALFFSSDYRSGQGRLFPYRFDKIPIQLISSVYEAFLKSEERKGKVIYYTPSFIVDFMLAHTLRRQLKQNKNVTVFDPACGSGAYLVESFKMIIDSHPRRLDYETKKKILENQLFGIDVDAGALRIAAFSLYLVLLESEDPAFIRRTIEHASPILPGLIGKTLIEGNALVDEEIFKGKEFDCIVCNPPWGSVYDDRNPENRKEREAINTKGKAGVMPLYKDVANYERSQAFLLRAGDWAGDKTQISLIVKNSNFLNDNAKDFRLDLLRKYRLTHFYELSDFDKILFKKRVIGEIHGEKVEIGASEPCAVLVFDKSGGPDNLIEYISPKLNRFSETFRLIHFTPRDVNKVRQSAFIEDDVLWKILSSGNIDDHQLIKKISSKKSKLDIACSIRAKNDHYTTVLENKIDETVFDLYGLLEFEKEMIREFYQVRVERKNDRVNEKDIREYVDKFRRNFESVLARDYSLKAEYWISANIGAVVRFQIAAQKNPGTGIERNEIPYLDLVKEQQLQQAYFSKMLNEDKVKIYEKDSFYLVKSSYFKDWTQRQAVKDANEEIGLLLKNLPGREKID